jgi:flavin reductase (DIM6/NTAB) family NADH-FMN oxidoreductase RutF
MADEKNVIPADYVGIVSGNKVSNKIEKTGWTVIKSEKINAPIFNELPLVLECELESYDEESEVLIGKVIGVSIDESILNADGNIDLNKFKPICYDCGTHGYYVLGKRVGNAFSDGKF